MTAKNQNKGGVLLGEGGFAPPVAAGGAFGSAAAESIALRRIGDGRAGLPLVADPRPRSSSTSLVINLAIRIRSRPTQREPLL
jgi:hypothetical protein